MITFAFILRRLGVALYGLINHGAFLVAVGMMAVGLYTGMRTGAGTLQGTAAVLANGVLALQFPILHSFLLSLRGGRILTRLVPGELGKHLATTTYTLVSAAQLFLVFHLWSPMGPVLWSATGAARVVVTVLCAASWAFLAKAIYDAGLAIQTGSLGWTSVYRGREPDYGTMPRGGLFRLCRQPIYLGFALVLWVGPVWTVDRIFLGGLWTAYCLLGARFKEARYRARYGEEFSEYARETPFFLPLRFRRRSDGRSP